MRNSRRTNLGLTHPLAQPTTPSPGCEAALPAWVRDVIAGLPPIVTTTEAMAVLRTSRRHLYRLIATRRLHAVRGTLSGSSPLLIPRSSIEAYLVGLEVA